MPQERLKSADQIRAIISRAEKELHGLRASIHHASIQQEEPLDLAISAMIIAILSRSILDHVAADIWNELGLTPQRTVNERPWTPYFPLHANEDNFEKAINKDFKKLRPKFPRLYNTMKIFQPFDKRGNFALALVRLADTYKHSCLISLTATKELLKPLTKDQVDEIQDKDPEAYRSLWSFHGYSINGHGDAVVMLNEYLQYASQVFHTINDLIWEGEYDEDGELHI